MKQITETIEPEKELLNLYSVDTDGNGKLTVAEIKVAGYSMSSYSDHWLYQDDREGMVGEWSNNKSIVFYLFGILLYFELTYFGLEDKDLALLSQCRQWEKNDKKT